MSFEITGKLIAKYDTVQKSDSFRTREFVIEKSESGKERTFVNYIKFQCTQDKTSMIDRVSVGDEVKVYFNLKGNKWEKEGRTSYFTNLDAWRIEQLLNPNSQGTDNEFLEPLDTFTATNQDNVDDLPF